MSPESLDLDFIALQSALAGQYSLERELGRGGMSVVYVAAAGRALANIDVAPPIAGLPSRYGAVVAFGFSRIATVAGGFIGIFSPGRRVERKDHLAVFRLRLWRSMLGATFARPAAWRLRPASGAAVAVNRPAEVAIGLAAVDDVLVDRGAIATPAASILAASPTPTARG